MTAARQRGCPHVKVPANVDLIAPETRGHIIHYRPVFPKMHIIDAEFEDITSEASAAGESTVIAGDRKPRAKRLDAGRGRNEFFGRDVRLAAVGPIRQLRFFPAALAGLCAVSFWIFGGHAVFARLTGQEAADTSPPVISGASMRLSVIDGTDMATVDGQVTGSTPARHKVPPIGVSSGEHKTAVAVQPVDTVFGAGASSTVQVHLPVAEGRTPAADVTFIDNGPQAD